MRLNFPALLLLTASAALPTLAHADGIDDFVLTGDGHTLTFSLPSTYIQTRTHGSPAIVNNATASRDGIGGYGLYIAAYEYPFFVSGLSIQFETFPTFSYPPPYGDSYPYFLLDGPSTIALISTTPDISGYGFWTLLPLPPAHTQ